MAVVFNNWELKRGEIRGIFAFLCWEWGVLVFVFENGNPKNP